MENIELRSPKVRNIIGKMPRGLVVVAVVIYFVVLLLILIVVLGLDIESAGMLNRLFVR